MHSYKMTLSKNSIILALALVLNLIVLSECALKSNSKPISTAKLTSIDDNGHFCCKIERPLQYLTKTRITATTGIDGNRHRCGYSNCGFLGWGSCTKWCMSYRTKTTYHTENYVITQQTACPLDQISCCKDHILIHGNCFHISEVIDNSALIFELQNQGITITDLPGIGRK